MEKLCFYPADWQTSSVGAVMLVGGSNVIPSSGAQRRIKPGYRACGRAPDRSRQPPINQTGRQRLPNNLSIDRKTIPSFLPRVRIHILFKTST